MAPQKPLESCAVCHGDTAIYAAKGGHAISGKVTVTNVTFAVNGADLVVTYNLKNDGANSSDFTTVNRDYRFADGVRTDLGTITTATSTGSGNYSITVPGGAANAGTNYRYFFRVANPAGVQAQVSGDFPAALRTDLVSSQACANCHSGKLELIHATSGYGNPMGASQCVVCHNRTGTSLPSIAQIGHSIHNSHLMPGGEYVHREDNPATPGDERMAFAVTYPTYMTNCSVCHDTPATLAAANSMPTTGPGCLSCHGSMESWDEVFNASGLTFHDAFDETTDCQSCHKVGGVAQEKVLVTDYHNGLETDNAGIIWNGEDLSVKEAANFTWKIDNIVDDGANVKISWSATYKGAPVNPCNTTVTATAPGFHAVPVIEGSLGFLRSYAQGDDFILGQANAPGQPNNTNLSTTNTTCTGNVATTTLPVETAIPKGTRGIVALQGKPQVPTPTGGPLAHWPHNTMYVRVPTPTAEWIVGSSGLVSAANDRRDIVDTGACLKCHVGSLYQHGNTRVDNVGMCILCHNSASNEQNRRVVMGVDASEAYDGKVGETFEMKTMLHAIHSAGGDGQKGIIIYRNRGIYAFQPEGVLPPNWPTGAPTCKTNQDATGAPITGHIVFGSDPASADKCQTHNLHHPTYPRAVNDCTACHSSSFAYMPDQTKAMATTLDAGSSSNWRDQKDDVLKGATSAACTSCHQSSAAAGHANQNGWVPAVFPNGRQTIIDAAK